MLAIARLARRAGALGLLLLVGAGCGESDPPPPVTLEVISPADSGIVRERAVEVRGRVDPPGARVLVRGRPATVNRGAFRAYVPLREGPTVIDVGAYDKGSSPAWAAVRVAREVVVTVPDLSGASRDDAVEDLEGLGLRPVIDEEEGGLLDRLLPADWKVCESQPEAGTKVPKGGAVRVAVSKRC